MTQAFTVFLTTFYVVWLVAVLLLLWKIWRNGATRAQRLEETLVEASLTTAKAARQASEAALLLAQQQESRRTEP